MTSLARGEVIGTANPRLVFWASREGKAEDLSALAWEAFDVHDDTNRINPSSVDSGSVDLVTDRLGLGRYAVSWTVPATAQIGAHEVHYTYRFDGDTADRVARVGFEVLEGPNPPGPAYVTVAALRAEGLPCGQVSDARAQVSIAIASQLIERVTGRFFEPRHLTIRLNGAENRMCLLGDPVIMVESIALDTEPDQLGDLFVEPNNYRVFSRHLSQGLLNPDDRENPKIEFVHARDLYGLASPVRFRPAVSFSLISGAFPSGVQNVEIAGTFGYTEPLAGGPPWGTVPILVQHLTKLLAFREVKTLAQVDCRQDSRERWRIVEEKTRDQSYKLAQPRKFGSQITGDAEIDSLLTMFTRPPDLGRV